MVSCFKCKFRNVLSDKELLGSNNVICVLKFLSMKINSIDSLNLLTRSPGIPVRVMIGIILAHNISQGFNRVQDLSKHILINLCLQMSFGLK